MKSEKFLKIAREVLDKESKLIEIKKVHPVRNNISNGARKVVFIGDTHGDLEASQKIIKEYSKPGNKIVFLGDYVDRGPHSKENLDFLLETKMKNLDQIYLLQGNHEGHRVLSFSPADFWERLNEKEYQIYTSIVGKFPLAAITRDIIALHGVLPNLNSTGTVPVDLKEINKIKIGDEQWFQITWGDFSEESGEYLGINSLTGRPQFGRDYFLRLMKKFNKKVLIRSHQPDCPQFMFNDRCLTIFTSSAYTRERTIAIADLTKEIKTVKDLEIKMI